ncbi:MAG: hypothetical protein HY072_06910 [Deltaproteobacteria bacterium]|nr:hypothetical protein [Deltaproteobacteria bacterium]
MKETNKFIRLISIILCGLLFISANTPSKNALFSLQEETVYFRDTTLTIPAGTVGRIEEVITNPETKEHVIKFRIISSKDKSFLDRLNTLTTDNNVEYIKFTKAIKEPITDIKFFQPGNKLVLDPDQLDLAQEQHIPPLKGYLVTQNQTQAFFETENKWQTIDIPIGTSFETDLTRSVFKDNKNTTWIPVIAPVTTNDQKQTLQNAYISQESVSFYPDLPQTLSELVNKGTQSPFCNSDKDYLNKIYEMELNYYALKMEKIRTNLKGTIKATFQKPLGEKKYKALVDNLIQCATLDYKHAKAFCEKANSIRELIFRELFKLTPEERDFVAISWTAFGEARTLCGPEKQCTIDNANIRAEMAAVIKTVENRFLFGKNKIPGAYELLDVVLENKQFSMYNQNNTNWAQLVLGIGNDEEFKLSYAAYRDYQFGIKINGTVVNNPIDVSKIYYYHAKSIHRIPSFYTKKNRQKIAKFLVALPLPTSGDITIKKHVFYFDSDDSKNELTPNISPWRNP